MTLFFTLGLFKAANTIRYGFGEHKAGEDEHVMLVDENNTPIDTASRASVTPTITGHVSFPTTPS